MDLERELTRVLHAHDTPLPVADPVPAVHAGMARRRRRRRVQVLSAALGVVAVALGAGLLVTGSPSSAPEVPARTPVPERTPSDLTAVPLGFAAQDVSFTSTEDGWALGTAPCGAALCTVQLVTSDGGRSWVRRPAPTLPRTCTAADCLSQVRFADARVGYAFGTSLYVTGDGGKSWTRQQTGDVAGLELGGDTVVRVVTPTRGCAPNCGFVVQRAPIGSFAWQTVKVADPGWTRASLVRRGDRLVVTLHRPAFAPDEARTALLVSNDGGRTWPAPTEPCGKGVDASQTALGSLGQQVAWCYARVIDMGGSVRFSSDSGRTFTAAQLLADGALAFASVGERRALVALLTGRNLELQLTTDAGRTWRTVASQPFVNRPVRLTVDDATGRGTWVAGDGATLWRTSDGGASWTSYPFRP